MKKEKKKTKKQKACLPVRDIFSFDMTLNCWVREVWLIKLDQHNKTVTQKTREEGYMEKQALHCFVLIEKSWHMITFCANL